VDQVGVNAPCWKDGMCRLDCEKDIWISESSLYDNGYYVLTGRPTKTIFLPLQCS
jgi:hypothetical protein